MDSKSEETLKKFFSRFQEVKFKKKETIIRADDNPAGVYYIKTGFVKMNSIFENGSELTLNIFKPGSFFPMVWAIGEVENSYFYQTMSDIVAYKAPRDEVVNFINQQPDILYDLMKRILIGMDGLFTNVQHLLYGNSYNRVASAVFIFAKRFGQKIGKDGVLIILPLTHQDIANMAGLTRETTSIALGQLKKRRIIIQSRHNLFVKSVPELERETLVNINNVDEPTMV